MEKVHRTTCCGCRSIPDLTKFKTPVDVLKSVGCSYIAMRGAFLVFTSTTKRTLGRRLANYIKENKLGNVVESDYRAHGKDNVRVFMWSVNIPAWKTWMEKNGAAPVVGARVRLTADFFQYYGENMRGLIDEETTIITVGQDWNTISLNMRDGRRVSAYANHYQLI